MTPPAPYPCRAGRLLRLLAAAALALVPTAHAVPAAHAVHAAHTAHGRAVPAPAPALRGLPLPDTPLPAATARPGAFPLSAEVTDAPADYRPGAPATWTLTVANRTTTAFRSVYPVVVLADDRRRLRAAQVRLDFHDGTRWHPARIERTERDENVAVPDDAFPGFTIGPRGELAVPVRLALAADAPADRVTASAALVQRDHDDGAWVGAADPYAFRVTPGGPPPPGHPRTSPSAAASTGPGPSDAPTAPPADPSDAPAPDPHQLAMTGQRASALVAAAAALLLAGTTVYLAARRIRPPRR
ncbi:hypothetical protein [Streptomyces sp. NPDC005955]|uniref:hypothetical protein n=1 Tax=Streptomyces sp. NPDC005955 TaxID=3364738 RepID=UPI0036807095